MNRLQLMVVAGSILLCPGLDTAAADDPSQGIPPADAGVAVYPQTYESDPNTPSPFRAASGEELVLIEVTDGRLAYAPVTVENGDPYLCVCESKGKGTQLGVSDEFPTLRTTGLHAEDELDRATGITGYPLSVIDCIARPRAFSYEGFIAEDESIVDVLKGDNRTVRALRLKHRQLAVPLFHVWNLLRLDHPTECMIYNGHRVRFRGKPTKCCQESIFRDGIQGTWDMALHRDLSPHERAFLAGRYPRLGESARADLEARLSHLRIGEMNAFYIMRYGFYEGHTMWRADPIAIALIFGLRSAEELADAFGDDLYERLTRHYSKGRIAE
jgi:hypothetical protein